MADEEDPAHHLPRLLPAPPGLPRPLFDVQQKRRKISTACYECRTHRRKCTGERPACQPCTSRSLSCRYIETEKSEIKEQGQLANHVLGLMKSLSETDAIDVLRRLRAGDNLSNVVRHVRDGNLLLQLSLVPETERLDSFPRFIQMPAFLLTPQNVYLTSTIYEATIHPHTSQHGPAYTMPFRAAEVVDPLIDRVSASRWTNVISDDELLKRLLKSFFQYAYQEWFPFHKDLFLSDMILGRTRFCSPLLVNAVLANACYTCRDLPNRAKYWLPDNLTYKFTAEAKRLWELESLDTQSHVTTVQASQILSVIMEFDAIKLGRAFTVQGLAMAHSLNLFQTSQDVESHKMKKARIWTAWSQYAWQAMLTYNFLQKPYQLEPPEDSLPPDPAWYGEIYLRYPRNERLTPTNLQHCVMAKCSLRTLMNNIGTEAFRYGVSGHTTSGEKLLLERAMHYKTDLETWFSALPAPLQPVNIIFPKDIGTHLEYLSILADLFEPHTSISTAQVSQPSGTLDAAPNDIVSETKKQREFLLRLYHIHHSFDNFDPIMIKFIIAQLGACVADLSDHRLSVIPEAILHSTFLLCGTALRAQAKFQHVCTLAYLGLQSDFRPADLQLLLTYTTPPTESDMPPYGPMAITSWPLPIIKINEDPSKSALNNLVQEYEKMTRSAEAESSDASDSETNLSIST